METVEFGFEGKEIDFQILSLERLFDVFRDLLMVEHALVRCFRQIVATSEP